MTNTSSRVRPARPARALALGASLVFVPAAAGAYTIPWHSCDGGGGRSTGGAFSLTGTIGQPDVGAHNGAAFCVAGGLWAAGIDPCGDAQSCVADLNGDGMVDGVDLGLLLSDWAGSGIGDLNDDGLTDGGDLGILLGAWGPC